MIILQFPGELAGINDVDSGDYTGFSLLGEDLLGDLFGESSNKKKSNKNKKKQAPAPTTTTTKRPRPNRRPTRKPSSRATTARPTRSTTVKIRPAGNRRTTRKPSRRPNRPNRRPTTAAVTENSISSSLSTSTTTSTAPVQSFASTPIPTTILNLTPLRTSNDETLQPVVIVTQKPQFTMAMSTEKPETNFADPGLEMSLAHITGQLSAMPETSIISEGTKDAGIMSTMHDHEQTAYEKIETITPKGTTVSFTTSSKERDNGDKVQIVQNLDSSSEENALEKDNMSAEETRTYDDSHTVLPPPRQNRNSEFSLEDLDVLRLDKIGETVGDQLGLFGRNKRQNKHKDTKVHGESEDSSDYDVLGLEAIGETVGDQLGLFGRNKRQNKHRETKFAGINEERDFDMLGLDTLGLDSLGETLGLERSDKNKMNRRRQNKMMRGEWSRV